MEPDTRDDDRYIAIYQMAGQGANSAQISQAVGTPVGEVDLILSLRAPD